MSYRAFMLNELQEELSGLCETRVMESASGCFLLSNYGARLQGLYPNPDFPNVLWTHENLGAMIEAGHWMVGGERLWVSPERDFFYENPRDFDGFHVPAGFDPGSYELRATGEYHNEFSLLDLNTNEVFDGSVSQRRFAPLTDPYGSGLAFAGARINDRIAVPTASLRFCAWSLAMLYTRGSTHPGTAFFPIKPGATLLNYFNPIPTARGEVLEGYARFAIDGEASYKLAIAPEDSVVDTPCKAVSVSPYPQSEQWFCVVKRCTDMARSQDECLDIPQSNPNGRRGAIQSYNHGPTDGPIEDVPFGEIELQLPQAQPKENALVSEATHELLAYAGSRDEMLELARSALRIDTTPQAYGN